jgi:hypothetical protein
MAAHTAAHLDVQASLLEGLAHVLGLRGRLAAPANHAHLLDALCVVRGSGWGGACVWCGVRAGVGRARGGRPKLLTAARRATPPPAACCCRCCVICRPPLAPAAETVTPDTTRAPRPLAPHLHGLCQRRELVAPAAHNVLLRLRKLDQLLLKGAAAELALSGNGGSQQQLRAPGLLQGGWCRRVWRRYMCCGVSVVLAAAAAAAAAAATVRGVCITTRTAAHRVTRDCQRSAGGAQLAALAAASPGPNAGPLPRAQLQG